MEQYILIQIQRFVRNSFDDALVRTLVVGARARPKVSQHCTPSHLPFKLLFHQPNICFLINFLRSSCDQFTIDTTSPSSENLCILEIETRDGKISSTFFPPNPLWRPKIEALVMILRLGIGSLEFGGVRIPERGEGEKAGYWDYYLFISFSPNEERKNGSSSGRDKFWPRYFSGSTQQLYHIVTSPFLNRFLSFELQSI